ncbi:MAG: alpha/beta hydrolase-fold protein, partial [Clostridia bacterium]|nr:alpha/beta hydrolase-fold protein [Clostridia bacterium]
VEKDTMSNEEYLTSVYVPYDSVKQSKSTCVVEQAPRASEKGTVLLEATVTNDGTNTGFGVYLPYNFDAEREQPYPLLAIYHGGGGFCGSWLNNGLANILDNMIAEGRMEPTVVVTPDATDLNYSGARVAEYLENTLLPYISDTYNASTDPQRRALAGLSAGGNCTMYVYFNNTELFDTYIAMSPPMHADTTNPNFEKPELMDVNLFIGFGLYDHVATRAFYNEAVGARESSAYDYVWGLGQAGVPFKIKNDLHYGHQWNLWRELAVYTFDNFLWK